MAVSVAQGFEIFWKVRSVNPQEFPPPLLPVLHTMLAEGVPEHIALRWHEGVMLLKAHANNMARCIEQECTDIRKGPIEC